MLALLAFVSAIGASAYVPGLGPVGLSALVFYGLRICVVPYASHACVAAFRSDAPMDRLLWLNTSVSLLHSILSSCVSLAVLSYHGRVFFDADWVLASPDGAILPLAISTGYFLYDFYDLIAYKLWLKAPGILAHHIMVGACYASAIVYGVGQCYLVVMLLLELNSVFLHARKLLSMAGYNMTHAIYAIAWQGVWVTFVATRGVLPIAVHVAVFADRARFPHLVQYAMAFGGMAILHVLNVLVCQGCWKAYRKDVAAKSK
ncbi:hypothetical protein SDRG_14553 [Saprolegnia diclina VS20]|uniref:TLC domain-containing protein n=1 Tax=Saprolegnia diclina (strain VS20) TaxID=1156394 RepID=T0R6D2_SAPDV|nr:hypothetical protein SDRG_14553 [Saprolegnia diclina VS20]EQC27643.1 hypothetical protein SDRG_14553 [Saprolegnia diclina VS20]|eukprot:XP_008618911.1 hypothetical protein SDRG_14553 [Saprolegnia diclina VS20]